MAIADDEDNGPVKPKSPAEFVKTYGPIAVQVGKDIGVDPRVLLGQWGMETGWGKSIIGDHNLGNIKDATGKGIRAQDKRENSNDAYLSFDEPQDFARYYSDFIKRGYPSAMNTGTDVSKYVSGLASGVNGSYFGKTDPKEYEKLVSGAQDTAARVYEVADEEPPEEDTGKPAEAVGGAKIPPASTEPGSPENTMMGVIGGVTGAGIASSLETGKRLLPLIPNIMNRLSGQAVDMDKPVSKLALQNWLNSMLQSNGQSVKLPISELEKLTGKKIRTMSEVGDAYRDIQEIKETKITKPMVKMVEGRPGVFEQTGRMTTSTIPGREAIDLTPYETKRTGPVRQAISNQLQTAGEVTKGALPSVGRVGVGALGGALAGKQLYDAFDQYKKEGEGLHLPSPRNAAQFASGAGGALSVLPFGITQVVGGALQVPELAYQGYDAIKELNRRKRERANQPVNLDLINVDPMANQMP